MDCMEYQNNFNKYLYWLGCYIPKEMQEEAYNFFVDECRENDIQYIICKANPHTWDNAICVLRDIGYPKNKSAVQNIMYLFRDINWECAQVGLSVIKDVYAFEPTIVVKAIEKAAKIADKDGNDEWLFGLSWLKECLRISKNDFTDSETITILYKGQFWDSTDEII